jgi:hypothetical protein
MPIVECKGQLRWGRWFTRHFTKEIFSVYVGMSAASVSLEAKRGNEQWRTPMIFATEVVSRIPQDYSLVMINGAALSMSKMN